MIYYNELNNFLFLLEKEIINNNGIIYDKYVCDKLLATFFKKAFINKKLSLNRFYDITYDKETIDRFIKNQVIKIAFKHGTDHIRFYTFITNNINIIDKLKIEFEITISNDEPPFKHNNYICYGLLLSKDENEITIDGNKKIKYYYSKNTGTPYDNMDNSIITKKIITDIKNKTTQYIRGFHNNHEIFIDIYKMIGNGWQINNLPYIITTTIKPHDCCPICLDKFSNTKKEVANLFENIHRLHSNNYHIHHLCLVKFLATQKNALYFKCPYRYKIDFNICKYLIDYNN
jgi:hypothetical protein